MTEVADSNPYARIARVPPCAAVAGGGSLMPGLAGRNFAPYSASRARFFPFCTDACMPGVGLLPDPIFLRWTRSVRTPRHRCRRIVFGLRRCASRFRRPADLPVPVSLRRGRYGRSVSDIHHQRQLATDILRVSVSPLACRALSAAGRLIRRRLRLHGAPSLRIPMVWGLGNQRP